MPSKVDANLEVFVHPLQAHIQNLAIEAISKVRPDPDSANTSLDADIELMRHSPAPMEVDRDSPTPRLAMARADGSPMRTLVPEMSFRTSAYGSSLGDTSMVSMVSTAPTSFAPGSTASSTAGMDLDRATVSEAGHNVTDGHGRPQRSNLALSDIAFHFEMTPTTAVEPLGLGTTERLLAPDWEEEEVERETRTASELAFIKAARETATSKLPSAPTSSISPEMLASETVTTPARARFVIDQAAPMRLLNRRTLVETQALELAKQSKDAADRPTVGGLTISSASKEQSLTPGTTKSEPDKRSEGEQPPTSKRKDARLPNAWEVVDPVALLTDL